MAATRHLKSGRKKNIQAPVAIATTTMTIPATGKKIIMTPHTMKKCARSPSKNIEKGVAGVGEIIVDEDIKRIYYLVLKEGWSLAGSGFKIVDGGRQMYLKISHQGFDLFNIFDIGPVQRLHWRSKDIFDGVKKVTKC
jgi:hypothetical protein